MQTMIAFIITATLQAGAPTVQAPPALIGFLEARATMRFTSRPVDFRVDFKSASRGKPKGAFQDSGVLYVGTTDKGVAWVSAPQKTEGFPFGETPRASEGQRWFSQFCEPYQMGPLADPGSLLKKLVSTLPLKGIENAPEIAGEAGGQVLIYRLEAPRPTAKFYTFQSKTGEARLHVRKDGSPSSLEVVQSYEGRLSPHFGTYRLNRRESWIFTVVSGRIETTKYLLSLRRQDWNESMEGEVELAVGALQ